MHRQSLRTWEQNLPQNWRLVSHAAKREILANAARLACTFSKTEKQQQTFQKMQISRFSRLVKASRLQMVAVSQLLSAHPVTEVLVLWTHTPLRTRIIPRPHSLCATAVTDRFSISRVSLRTLLHFPPRPKQTLGTHTLLALKHRIFCMRVCFPVVRIRGSTSALSAA